MLEHCVLGTEALTADTHHGPWRHGFSFVLADRCNVGALIDGAIAKAGEVVSATFPACEPRHVG